MKEYDALVIGGGPAGITAALYLLRAGANIAWVEKLAPGGQVLQTEWIDNYPGFPDGVKGFELADLLAKHLEGFSFDRYMEEIEAIEFKSGKNRVSFGDDGIQAKTIVVCSGAEHRKLGLQREESLTGKGVSYCGLCDGNFFRDQVVACIGGGNTALEDSLYLSGLTKKVYLLHRRDTFRGEKIYQDKVMAQPNIEILFNTVPERLLGEDEVEGLEIKDVKTEEKRILDVDGVFIFVGLTPSTHFIPESLTQDKDGFIETDTEMRTNMPGVFAAGDVRSKRCRQVATAVGDGAVAGHSAHLFIEEMQDE